MRSLEFSTDKTMHDPHASGPRVRTDTPIVETTQGKVRGFLRDDVHMFLGLAYGAPTGGAARFQAPRSVAPWVGVRQALAYGPACPQALRSQGAASEAALVEEAFLFGWGDSPQSEDCLRLNIWTPGLDGARRPVMVWLHGGHFASGSGHEQAAFEGSNLARRGDVVVVSLNHRLNILGHLNLAAYGGRYAGSGNAGMLDIVLALQWIRENIASFGGDPGCVTVFGQSGGGAKVTTLMAMPMAKGLFHRAIVQSNCALRQMDSDLSQRLTQAVLDELGLAPDDVGRLHELPYETLSRVELAAVARLCPPANPARRNRRVRWEPVVDGVVLPQHAFDPQAPDVSADVPLLVGTTLNEFTHAIGAPHLEALSEAEVRNAFAGSFGPDAPAVIAMFRSRHPDASWFDISSRAYSATIRQWAVLQASRKAAQRAAPAFLYWFHWQTPVLGGRPRAYHNAELPFVFDNADRCATATGGGPGARQLAGTMADAWIAFARSGNPNHPGLPDWPQFSDDAVPTMIFDTHCRAEDNPDGPERSVAGAA